MPSFKYHDLALLTPSFDSLLVDQYTLGLSQSYLLRGVVQALAGAGFISDPIA
ncbi:hypothetical protein D3C76_329400 [compost metagenome]|uniref:Uncharacterized protein n=1 Tax=Pseudomonas jinjuensis TaxID=198616 RepID=A0A1H0K4P7_9PSED|nr:hypothetical protein SAMN05216193_11239 [Pseudomonas jinjuensis]